MKHILTLAKWELTRLRVRFSGQSKYIVLAVVLLAVGISYLIYHQGLVFSRGFYVVGVSPEGPVITDKRFTVIRADRETGYALLQTKAIDLYIDGGRAVSQGRRGQYAAGALRKYLEKQEVARIAQEYEMGQAFPLRVEIRYLESLAAEPVEIRLPETGPTGPPEPAAPPVVTPALVPGQTLTVVPAPVTPNSGNVVVTPAATSTTDAAVKAQLDRREGPRPLRFEAEFVSENDVIIPSLSEPPIPLSQVIIALLYIVPIFFVSIFFTSTFTEEKLSRKVIVLLSAPVTRLQVILGKMLPYLVYAVLTIIIITLALRGNILLGLAIFIPVALFIFAIYLMVALTYRTFKDETFFSVLALSAIVVYLVTPAMLTGVSDLSYISPLTLAVEMFRGASFNINQYFLATAPLYLVFALVLYTGNRLLNEEFLTGYRPLHAKVAEALYLIVARKHPGLSIPLLTIALMPAVFMVQLASIVFVTNLPESIALRAVIVVSAVVEEVAKSAGVAVLVQRNVVRSMKGVTALSALSALGFFAGEKLLLFLALSVVSESMFMQAVFGAGLLVAPLVMHVVTTVIVGLLTARLGTRYYAVAIVAGTLIHVFYNLYVIGALR
ncbi:MAG: ABC transporter permease [Chloroflexi bacterium]|nr:ABC transporter permease [Chloroflexota bacterium]